MNNTSVVFEQLLNKYPFITILSYGDSEFIGIIQNQDSFVTSLYNFGDIKNVEERKLFLKLGEYVVLELGKEPLQLHLCKVWL